MMSGDTMQQLGGHFSAAKRPPQLLILLTMLLLQGLVQADGDGGGDVEPEENRLLREAYLQGLQEAIRLHNVTEPWLVRQGMSLGQDDAGMYLGAINRQSEEAKRLSVAARAALGASSFLARRLRLTRRQAAALERLPIPILPNDVDQQPLSSSQQVTSECYSSVADSYLVYRTPDGRCNNLAHPEWGSSLRAFRRFVAAHYHDGVQEPRRSVRDGTPLPPARLISATVHWPPPTQSLQQYNNRPSVLFMQWGQFIDHDLTATAQTRGADGTVPKCCDGATGRPLPTKLRHPDCMPLEDATSGGGCMEMMRSSPAPIEGPGKAGCCRLGARQQINQATSYLDASAVYGSDARSAASLRSFRGGRLRVSSAPAWPRRPLLPSAPALAGRLPDCRPHPKHLPCFLAGDRRANEHPGLAAMHVLWVRQHNRLTQQLSVINPLWSDERLYQESRRIVAAQVQHITLKEFLPILLGHRVIRRFGLIPAGGEGGSSKYDPSVDATVANAFAAAAFRFGHSLVPDGLPRCDRRHRRLPSELALHQEMMTPAPLYNPGAVDRLLVGMADTLAEPWDRAISPQLTRHLFRLPQHQYQYYQKPDNGSVASAGNVSSSGLPLDLAAINVQRGRDHGLPPYASWREACGLPPFKADETPGEGPRWGTDSGLYPSAGALLANLYKDPSDVDLFPAAMSEKSVPAALVGPTFACILAQQFSNLRRGDRFWYEHQGLPNSFTEEQLAQIRRTTLARVICDNLDDVSSIQPLALLQHDNDTEGEEEEVGSLKKQKEQTQSKKEGNQPRNRRVSCKASGGLIPSLDLEAWRQLPDTYSYASAPPHGAEGDDPPAEEELEEDEDEEVVTSSEEEPSSISPPLPRPQRSWATPPPPPPPLSLPLLLKNYF